MLDALFHVKNLQSGSAEHIPQHISADPAGWRLMSPGKLTFACGWYWNAVLCAKMAGQWFATSDDHVLVAGFDVSVGLPSAVVITTSTVQHPKRRAPITAPVTSVSFTARGADTKNCRGDRRA